MLAPTNPLCPRHLALWKPGEPQPGVGHRWSWSGSTPLTGVLRCTLCGARELEENIVSED